MSKTSDLMLSVSQVIDLPPGDDTNASWINPGFAGVVSKIEKRPMKKGGFMWVCVIADINVPADYLNVSFFAPPRFGEGDTVEIFGKGLRRTEYNGAPQASMGKDTECEVTLRAANRGAANRPAVEPGRLQPPPAADPNAPRNEREAQMQEAALRSINGQSVGCAMNNTFEMFRFIYTPAELREMIKTPEFWAASHEFASDFLRVSQLLEKGKIAKSVRDRCAPPPAREDHIAGDPAPAQRGGRADPPKAASRPQAGPGGSVAHDNTEEDVPF